MRPHPPKSATEVRYRKSPRDTCRTVKLKLTLTLVLTLTDTGGAVLSPDPNARIQKFITLHGNSDFCDSGLSPLRWLVGVSKTVSMRRMPSLCKIRKLMSPQYGVEPSHVDVSTV